MEKVEITVIGAGVVGLAVAYELSKRYKDVFVIEKEDSFGQGTSSRNSEVIHAGIYYPKGSLKARACIEGRRLLYDFCASHHIPHKVTGKIIVARDAHEVGDLEKLYEHGQENGVTDLRLIDGNAVRSLEPQVKAEAAILSPSTGIIDSHSLMKALAEHFQSNSGAVAYATEAVGIDKVQGGYEVTVRQKDNEQFKFFSRILINAAGLTSDTVATMAGLGKDEYRLKYCKGDYVRVHSGKARLLDRLVYPVPRKEGAGLGIHATLDLAGGLRLGPDDEYVKAIDYQVAPSKVQLFYENVKSFLPFLQLTDLSPDMAGIRPKLQGPGEAFRDFLIREETASGFPGLIDLIGIESPGLTACLSIAGMVKAMLQQ